SLGRGACRRPRWAPAPRAATTRTARSSPSRPGGLPDDRAGYRGRVLLLPPEADHDALLDLVPQPGGPVLQHEPPGRPVRRRLTATLPAAGGGPPARPAAALPRAPGCLSMFVATFITKPVARPARRGRP